MASIFYLIFIMMLSYALAAQNFVPVSVCPRDKYTWDLESVKKKCQGDTPNYLCAAIENQVGKYGEICTKFGLSPANKCAVLNEQTYNLDSVDCKAVSGCPQDPYIPSELWKYQICYEDFYGTTTSLAPITTPNITSTAAASSGSEDGGPGSGARVELTVVISLIFVAVGVIVVFYIFRDKARKLYTGLRQRFLRSDHRENVQFSDAEYGEVRCTDGLLLVQGDEENRANSGKVTDTSKTGGTKEGHKGKDVEPEKKIEKLKELLKYLVHILKQELRVIDLKEKVVIHSKSINEHFTEPLIKDLQSLNDINDYSLLDTSLVLTLLRNFCEGIKPSSKGWDYEPPEDETHVGADIERIRLMWNKYCDDDFEFKHLDEVYIRMKQKYGTVAVHGDDDNRKPPHKDKEKTKVVPGGDGIGKPPHKEEENKVVLGLDGNRKPPHKEEQNTEVVPGLDGNRIPPLKNKENSEVVPGLDGNRKPPHKEEQNTEVVPGLDGNRKPPHKDEENTEVVLGDDGNMKPLHKDEENSKGSECMKIKIPSIKLNEDCTVEKGIVITENITTALKNLKSRNVVILKGVIGCGKTHALKAIKNHFQERKWKMAWVESENFEGEISHEKPTIFLCDNLFGKFGASVFSQDAVNKTEKALKEIEISTKQETKVVIGIHTHVYDEVKKNFQLNFLHQKNITIEMDNLSEAEALLIFKEQLKKGHCKMNPNCWFKTVGFQSVLDRLSKNQGHIGGPFLSLMYCNQHELFSDEAFSVNCIPTLTQLFQKMKHDSPKLYDCLVYLMCVQQHNCEEIPKTWTGFISVDITKGNLVDLAKTSCLLQVENKIATLAHELLTTVLFKSAIENNVMVLPVLQVCESDVFLQLLRPSDNTQSGLYYEYMYGIKEPSRDVGKMCAYRLTRIYKKQELVHPLMAVGLVKEKYLNYLKHEPKHLIVIKGLM